MNQFRRRLFPSCAFRSRIFAEFSQVLKGSQFSRGVFRGVLKGSQIPQISQILMILRARRFRELFNGSQISRISQILGCFLRKMRAQRGVFTAFQGKFAKMLLF